jgi:putative transposase
MKLTLQLQLLPNPAQADSLRATMERFNQAANLAAQLAFNAKVFSQPSVHKLAYRVIRDRFSLSAQLAVRAIGKAVECFVRDKKVCPIFRPDGAITYDRKNLSFKGLTKVSLATLSGREVMFYVYGEYQRNRLDYMVGRCDLVIRNGKFFLMATIEMPEIPPIEIHDFVGVDLGIVNLATTNDGQVFSGEIVDQNRKRRMTARKQYQRKGTKSAKRRLRKMAGRQSRFQTIVNHTISKRIVGQAKALRLGIAIEDLKGIRDRVEDNSSHKFRRRFGNWGFAQLRKFIEYKSRLAGVTVIVVDPRNSSRTCSRCGHCEKANRKSQSVFVCKQCSHSMNADENAACNLRQRGKQAWATQNNLAPKAAGSLGCKVS